jgi:hypothetical protein
MTARGYRWHQMLVENIRHDVLRVPFVIGHGIGDGLRGSALGRLRQFRGPAIEQAAEDAREGQHVVDLVRLVAAAGGHDRRVPSR